MLAGRRVPDRDAPRSNGPGRRTRGRRRTTTPGANPRCGRARASRSHPGDRRTRRAGRPWEYPERVMGSPPWATLTTNDTSTVRRCPCRCAHAGCQSRDIVAVPQPRAGSGSPAGAGAVAAARSDPVTSVAAGHPPGRRLAPVMDTSTTLTDTPTMRRERVPVTEAAARLGPFEPDVRRRIKAGMLHAERTDRPRGWRYGSSPSSGSGRGASSDAGSPASVYPGSASGGTGASGRSRIVSTRPQEYSRRCVGRARAIRPP
jgi:hypothetical protein